MENYMSLSTKIKLGVATICGAVVFSVAAIPPEGTPWQKYNPIQLPEHVTHSMWSRGLVASAKSVQGNLPNSWSPMRWSRKEPIDQYGSFTRFIAHRGLVDLHKGIAENSVQAIYNAVNSEQFMIEIDVQATKDSVPVALHDNTLDRVLNLPDRVDSVNYSEIRLQPMLIKQPDQTHLPATEGACSAGDKIISLPGIITNTIITANMVRHSSFEQCPWLAPGAITWVLDPKNLNAAQSVMNYFTETGAHPYATQHTDSIVMKVYPSYYVNANGSPSTNPIEIANVAHKLNNTTTGVRPKIIPVVSVGSFLEADDVQGAVDLARAVARDWGQYFEVLSIEAPGAWNSNWPEFARRLFEAMRIDAHAGTPYFVRNPVATMGGPFQQIGVGGPGHPTNTGLHNMIFGDRYPPRVSLGYRFADYVKGGTWPKFQNGIAYDWSMEGQEQLDIAPKARRTIGGTAEQWWDYCGTGNGCWVTTDYPLHEWYKRYLNSVYPEPVHNGPMTNPHKPQ
jgi:hypothetical protein